LKSLDCRRFAGFVESFPPIILLEEYRKMSRVLLFVIFELALARSVFGQAYNIQTVAGGGWEIPGASANLSSLQGVAIDRAGNVFMALSAYSVVVRMDASGQLSRVAGNGTQGYSGDNGPATLAQLAGPTGIALDATGTVYIEDSGNNVIRMVSNGVISTVAGGGSAFPGDNGSATGARLGLSAGYGPGLAADPAGGLYFADTHGIRKVSNGVITTVAGGGFAFGDNIPATAASVNAAGVAIDEAGRIYFADRCSNRIRRVSDGTITTVAGNGTANAFLCAQPVAGGNGNATSVPLNGPQGVAVDTAGNVYFTEGAISGNISPSRARQVSNGTIVTVAGGSTGGPFGPGVADNVPAASVVLALANSIAVDTAGSLYIADQYWVDDGRGGLTPASGLGRLRRVSDGAITTIAGTNVDTGPAAGAQLKLPAGVVVDRVGNLYIADSSNNIVREVSNGAVATIAGTRAPSQILSAPQGIDVGPSGDLYIAQTGSVVELSRGGVATIADSNGQGIGFRGAGVALDLAGNLYFADWTGNRIRMASNGVVSTIAGDGTSGFSGDNGPAGSAQLANPSGVALDAAGNLYFTDTGNQRVRKISNGVITTVAGNGTAGFSGDNGPATGAQLNLPPVLFPPPPASPFFSDAQFPQFPQLPTGIAVDAAGNLYIVDSGNQSIRKISNGVITTVAGNGTPGYSGDGGPATSAQFNNPSGIAVDAGTGRIFVSDSSNGRIRVLIPPSCPSAVNASFDTKAGLGR
jgi:trimeric autotransporter adhesin